MNKVVLRIFAIVVMATYVYPLTKTVVFQTGLNSYTGVIDQELRDPKQGSIGATWHSQEEMLAVQEN